MTEIDKHRLQINKFDVIFFQNKNDFECFEDAVKSLLEHNEKKECDFIYNDEKMEDGTRFIGNIYDYEVSDDNLIETNSFMMPNEKESDGEILIVIDNTAWPEAIKQQDWKSEDISYLRGNNDVTVTVTIFSVYPQNNSTTPFIFAFITLTFFFILLLTFIFVLLRYLKDLRKLKMLNKLIDSQPKDQKVLNDLINNEKDENMKKEPLLSI